MRHSPVDDVRPGHPALDGAHAGLEFGDHAGVHRLQESAGLAERQLGEQ